MEAPNDDANGGRGISVHPDYVEIPSAPPCNTDQLNARIADKLVNSPWRVINRYGVELTENDVIQNLERVQLEFILERSDYIVDHETIIGEKEVLVFHELTANEKTFEVPQGQGLVFTPRSLQEWVMNRYNESRFVLHEAGMEVNADQLLYGLYRVKIFFSLSFGNIIVSAEIRNLLRHMRNNE